MFESPSLPEHGLGRLGVVMHECIHRVREVVAHGTREGLDIFAGLGGGVPSSLPDPGTDQSSEMTDPLEVRADALKQRESVESRPAVFPLTDGSRAGCVDARRLCGHGVRHGDGAVGEVHVLLDEGPGGPYEHLFRSPGDAQHACARRTEVTGQVLGSDNHVQNITRKGDGTVTSP